MGTFSFLEEMDASQNATNLQLFSLLVGAVIHDVGHPGYNNAFQSNSLSQKALTYNDNSVLENYHVSLAFRMIFDSDDGDNIQYLPRHGPRGLCYMQKTNYRSSSGN